jgi:hypothetical protein
MSEPDTLPAQVHREVTLLPWYVNGTLTEPERLDVDRHLATCPDCRNELDELTRLRRDLADVYEAQAGLSPQASQRILQNVTRAASTGRAVHPGQGSKWEHLDQWFRSLFLPRWVPMLAATLLLVQTGLLLWISAPVHEQPQITTRSLGTPAARIVVSFQQDATEAQIRSLLRLIGGRMVDGPTAGGLYTIEVLGADNAAPLKLLRAHPDVVRSADLVAP